MTEKVSENTNEVFSIVIRVRNAAAELERCLSALSKQVLPDNSRLEFIVVDNDSSDNSRQVASKKGAIIESIATDDFSWGRALNRGLSRAKGDISLILSADAYPADKCWVCEMVRPFAEAEVAAVYGRQLALPNAPIDEQVRLLKHFISQPMRFDSQSGNIFPTGKGMLVSNACAAIRTSLWRKWPYDETINAGEEGVWSYNAIQKGFSIVYQPSAKVYHSHKDSVLKFAWREWELYYKNSFLRNITLTKKHVFKWLGAFIFRRLKNCAWPNVSLTARIEGILRLPLEMIAFVIVSLYAGDPANRLKYREFFWK